jgi:hypothetical protein
MLVLVIVIVLLLLLLLLLVLLLVLVLVLLLLLQAVLAIGDIAYAACRSELFANSIATAVSIETSRTSLILSS